MGNLINKTRDIRCEASRLVNGLPALGSFTPSIGPFLGLSLALFSFQGEQEPKDREASKTVQVSVLKTSLIIIVGLLCSFILGPCFNRRNVKDKAMPKIKEASHKTIIIETSPVYIGLSLAPFPCFSFMSRKARS